MLLALLARHHEILNQSVQAHNGYVFQIIGDAFCVAFHNASDALNAALNAQRLLQKESWSPAPIRVRMGINTICDLVISHKLIVNRISNSTCLLIIVLLPIHFHPRLVHRVIL